MISNQAYCGLNCDECPAFIAKRTNNDTLREDTLKKWGSPEYPLTKDDINCDGCKSSGGALFKFCGTCSVRKCASQKGVETCAHCPDYGCDTLEEWLSHAGDKPREILENLRSGLA
ncbi:MAG: DUF3795 domain-containing protein [Candidatus Thorarchaeota archaeon]